MEVIIQRDYEQMSKTAAQIVVEVLNTKPNAVRRSRRVRVSRLRDRRIPAGRLRRRAPPPH